MSIDATTSSIVPGKRSTYVSSDRSDELQGVMGRTEKKRRGDGQSSHLWLCVGGT